MTISQMRSLPIERQVTLVNKRLQEIVDSGFEDMGTYWKNNGEFDFSFSAIKKDLKNNGYVYSQKQKKMIKAEEAEQEQEQQNKKEVEKVEHNLYKDLLKAKSEDREKIKLTMTLYNTTKAELDKVCSEYDLFNKYDIIDQIILVGIEEFKNRY